MEKNEKTLEVFNLFTSMSKTLGLLRDFHRKEAKNNLETAVLIFIKFHDKVSQAMIVERLKVPKQTISYTICKLEDEGAIETQANPEDKRQKILLLTDKGEAYAGKALGPLLGLHESLYDQLGPSKIKVMRAYIKEIIEIIEKETRREDG